MLSIILHQPEIPQNTGSIGRLCAFTNSPLHLIYPLGYKIEDKHLKRSGMDYWKTLDLHEHENWDAFLASPARPKRTWLFSTKAEQSFWDAKFEDGDGLIFGNEGAGAPDYLHEWAGERRVTIPNYSDHRSLNLATAAGIALYEAIRQTR